jgi:hypothetical protein
MSVPYNTLSCAGTLWEGVAGEERERVPYSFQKAGITKITTKMIMRVSGSPTFT